MVTPGIELVAQIKRFRESLEKAGIRQQQVLLYGSQRHGTATEGSDIDLIIISPDWDPLSRRERLELLASSQRGCCCPFNPKDGRHTRLQPAR